MFSSRKARQNLLFVMYELDILIEQDKKYIYCQTSFMLLFKEEQVANKIFNTFRTSCNQQPVVDNVTYAGNYTRKKCRKSIKI